MNITPVKKIATVLGAGSLFLGAVALAPAASAASAPAAVTAPASTAPDASGPTAGLRTSVVAAWYENFLGRSSANDAGAQYWVARLRTEPYDKVLADLLRTPEAASNQVDQVYRGFLGRSIAGDRGAQGWVNGIVAGTFTSEWVEQNVLASSEYIAHHSTPDGDAGPLVTSWYNDVLGRSPRGGEVDYWATRLENASPLTVLREIWFTPEAVGHRVSTTYGAYLKRTPAAFEVDYWRAAETRSSVGVVVAIASSTEYQNNALTRGVAG